MSGEYGPSPEEMGKNQVYSNNIDTKNNETDKIDAEKNTNDLKSDESPQENIQPPEGSKEKVYEKGKIKFFYDNVSQPYPFEIAKKIVDAMAPYIDRPVQLQFRKMNSENPGYCTQLNPEFRTLDYHHNVSVNSDYKDQSQLPASILHELGHCFEEKLIEVAKEEGLEILPSGHGDFHADLIPCYILNPEYLKKYINLMRLKKNIRKKAKNQLG